MLSLFGLSADQQAQREVSALNNKNTGFNDWDLGDMFRSAITGVSKEDVLQRAQNIAADQINENNTTLIGDTRRALAGTGLESATGLRYKPGQTEAEFLDNLTTDLNRGTAARQYLAQDGSDPTKIGADTQVSDLIGLSKTARDDVKKQTRQQNLDDVASERAHASGLVAQQLEAGRDQYNHSFRTQEARLAHQDKQNRLDRALERELGNRSSDLQMQLKLMDMDLADKRMAYDREMRAKDKRAAMIAQLMKGIGQLGAAF
jgi:hypothetical protein